LQWFTFIAGFIAGYKSGEVFDPYALGMVACFAAAIEGIVLLLFSSIIPWGWELVPALALGWFEMFAWGAVPCIAMGWLMSRKNVEGDE